VAIGFVLLLFNAVTAYGKAKLKAPAPLTVAIASLYSKPELSQIRRLGFNIEQSGIYLNGSLLCKAPTPREQELVRRNLLEWSIE